MAIVVFFRWKRCIDGDYFQQLIQIWSPSENLMCFNSCAMAQRDKSFVYTHRTC